MTREVGIDQVEGVLADLSYPLMRTDAAVELRDVTVRVDGEAANLGALISETDSDAFRSPDEISTELETVLPAASAGE